MNKLIYRIDGIDYERNGWFGCQIRSFERKRPPAGTCRKILDYYFYIYRTHRYGLFKFECCWTINTCGSLDEVNAKIRKLYEDLNNI